MIQYSRTPIGEVFVALLLVVADAIARLRRDELDDDRGNVLLDDPGTPAQAGPDRPVGPSAVRASRRSSARAGHVDDRAVRVVVLDKTGAR